MGEKIQKCIFLKTHVANITSAEKILPVQSALAPTIIPSFDKAYHITELKYFGKMYRACTVI